MRIGLISDTHIPEARPELWPQVFSAFASVDAILHAGDLHDVAIIDQLGALAPVWAARGNGEDGSGGRAIQPDHPRLRPTWGLEFEGVRVGLIHDWPVPEHPPNLTVARWLDRHFRGFVPDVVVYGDTHCERIDLVDDILCVNPGSPTFPHNYNTQLGTIGFLDISAAAVTPSIWLLTEDGCEPFDWETRPLPFR